MPKLTEAQLANKRNELERKGFDPASIVAILAALRAGHALIAKLLELFAKKKA